MAEHSIKTSRPFSAILMGLAATLAVTAVHLSQLDQRAELHALDLRLRHFPVRSASDRIVHVYIDDNSIQEVGQWPWPNLQLAGILEALEEAGAGSIVMDIVFPDPQRVRFDAPNLDLNSPAGEAVGAAPKPVFDDLALADTLRRYPNIFLAMHLKPGAAATLVERALHDVLLKRTTMDLGEAAAAVGRKPDAVRFEYRWAQEQAIHDRVAQVLAKQPETDFQAIVPLVLDGHEPDRHGRPLDLARQAYLRVRSAEALERHALAVEATSDFPREPAAPVPPLVHFVEAAGHVGFVDFKPDDDGVARRVRLLRQGGGKFYPQLAFAAALSELEREHGPLEIRADAAAVTLRDGRGVVRRIPLDHEGNMLVRWVPLEGYPQIAAAAVEAVFRERQSLENNRRLSRLLHVDLADKLANFRPELPGPQAEEFGWSLVEVRETMRKLYAEADEIDARLQDVLVRRQRALLFDPGNVPAPPDELQGREREVETRIEAACRKLRELLGSVRLVEPVLAATRPADAARVREAYENERRLFDHVAWLRSTLAALETEQPVIRERIASMVASLRAQVAGKVVLIGSSATSAADFVPTPLAKRTPGVAVHANVLETILSGTFLDEAPRKLNVAVIVLAGLAVAVVAALWPVYWSGPLAAVLAAAYVGFNSTVVFGQWHTHLALAAPLGAIAAALLGVTAYRQLTEERAKREIRNICAKALSPELLEEVERDPSVLRLGGEKRVVSCLFSDLAGFTPLSERLGEQATVRLLNRYFDRMTEVIRVRSGGYLNKFLGDGIFAFFGAPLAQEDHAARAIQAALLCAQEVAQLNAELAREAAGAPQLSVRIGIATGEVIVGNCGSSDRTDYTAIGDEVNLASRLEGANKFFGTRILTSRATWESLGAAPACGRFLGEVQVVGKNEPVGVWSVLAELPGGGDPLERAERAFADFTRAVELYAKREFAGAGDLFEQFLGLFPGDKAGGLYLKLCREYQANPPGADWAPVIRLTEK